MGSSPIVSTDLTSGFALVSPSQSEGWRCFPPGIPVFPDAAPTSPMGQSLLFLAEFRTRLDSTVVPAVEDGRLVVDDRGYLSKYGYQHAVMEPTMGEDADVTARCSSIRASTTPNT